MSVNLNTLYGYNHRSRKRVGRGIGSGRGKTSGRGVKGQKSRSGVSINSFEGGQQSIVTSTPKRGMKKHIKKVVYCFNLCQIQNLHQQKKIKDSSIIDINKLYELGVIKDIKQKVKILSKGGLSVPINFKVSAASKSAQQAIEKAGGTLIII